MSTVAKGLISVCHVIVFYCGFQLQRNDKELSDINTIGFSIYCSRGAALCLAFDMALIILPVCRKLLAYISRIAFALLHLGQGTISEGSNSSPTSYHKYLAYHVLAFLIIHVLGHCVNFYRLEQLDRGPAISYHFGTWAGVTGYWMLLLLSVMYITAHKRIRKRNYEAFWYTHHLALLVMVFFAFHGYGCFVKTNDGQCRGYGSWKYIVLASLIYLAERTLRALESSQLITLSSAVAHPGGAIELNFKHPSIHYRPGQHVYLNIPQLSQYEWHPFTITSSPIEQFISLDIRQDGDWTGQLGQLLGYGPETPRLEQTQIVRDRLLLPIIRIDGPYGGPKEDVLNFDHAILIGTGNGITTFSGILRHIWFRHQETQSSRLKTLDLYWVSRDPNKLEWFQSLFSMEKTMELFRTGLIRIHIYFTSSDSVHQVPIKRSSSSGGIRFHPGARPLMPLQTEFGAQERYSEDDDDQGEHEELLSPLERPVGSGSLISLMPIPSPSSSPHTELTNTSAITRSAENLEQGDSIIDPSNVYHGRPNFAYVFEAMSDKLLRDQEGPGQARVGVFYCGSPSLGRTLAQECRRCSRSGINKSPLPAIRDKAEWIANHGTCAVCKTNAPKEKSKPPKYECPDCGYPTHCSEEHYEMDKEHHKHTCRVLREVNEDEHDLRSGRRMKEFEFPGAQHRDEAINLSNWDTFLYTRGFLSMNSERSMRHVSHVLTYPLTIGSILHQSSPYRLGKDLTVEGLKSLAALRHTLHPTVILGSNQELGTPRTNTVRIFCLGARAESRLPPHIYMQLAYLFPNTAFQIHFVGPDAIPPNKKPKESHQHIHYEQLTFVYDSSRYEAYHAEAGPFNPYYDVFFLFSPGLAHPSTKEMWKPTIPLLLDTKCAIFGTGFDEEDVMSDIHEIESAGYEMDWLMKPRENVFRSLKHEINMTDVRQSALCNWGIWGIRGRRYDVRAADQ
ncbi:translational activator for mitochondrial COX1 [Modicella reniformis]|uniref:Translational activator for mitochondrial COX1 n=1 Tax=Modicella reniformis TaxID=1440133 RepID=A0A9P6SPR1_9FUNG|nr:translational activator for mitochondrial COX1 [Modicella reniformis]